MKSLILTLSMTMFFFIGCNEEVIRPEMAHQDNDLVASSTKVTNDNARMTGFDQWGFNYTAHLFKGYLINAMIGDPAFQEADHYQETPYRGEGAEFWDNFVTEYPYFVYWMPAGLLDCKITMRWNEALLPSTGIYPDTWNNSDAFISFKYTMDNWIHFRKLVAIQSTDYLDGDRWYNQYGEEIGMKSYYWPYQLIIAQVINVGDNPWVPGAMPPDYTAPNGHGWGTYGN